MLNLMANAAADNQKESPITTARCPSCSLIEPFEGLRGKKASETCVSALRRTVGENVSVTRFDDAPWARLIKLPLSVISRPSL
ncbi:hypothetical protein [Sinorhizobium medicae]|uniref:hypothetical protein n=1 Tax=Sinorhizobium medicae TaxID=110321 RepID=UPI00164937F4|nr:hypothetical protein [Sinorhizobium medicae]MBO1961617.1 hypothetical protein [Sinorhizobium medicae]WQO56119.1 hypothetical protein U8C36_28220 [Sinorhizobium medicae]WQP42045.1 hypothetical protein U8C38_29520 [Sinorhizobium medicae]